MWLFLKGLHKQMNKWKSSSIIFDNIVLLFIYCVSLGLSLITNLHIHCPIFTFGSRLPHYTRMTFGLPPRPANRYAAFSSVTDTVRCKPNDLTSAFDDGSRPLNFRNTSEA